MNLRSSLAKIKMIDLGIIPAMTGGELTKMLESLSPEDRKKVKRKFRKVWRKLSKNDINFQYLMKSENGAAPTVSQRRNRSVIVTCIIVKSIKV